MIIIYFNNYWRQYYRKYIYNNNVWVKDDLIIQNLGSKNNSFLTKNNIQNDIKIIKNIYKSKGFKDVSVIAKVEKYSLDRVNLYIVEENEQQKLILSNLLVITFTQIII